MIIIEILTYFRIAGYLQHLTCIDGNTLIMKKLAKKTYKGIEYVRLDSLPRSQADALIKSLNPRTLVKIQMYEEVIEDCVLFEAYEKWYSTYQKETSEESSVATVNNSVSLT